MARKNLLIGIALAASLLTACSSGDTAATSTSTSSTSTSSSSAAAPSSQAETSETSADDTSADSSGTGVAAADLDEVTTTWFSAFCGDLTELQTSSEAIGKSISAGTGTPQEQQTAIVAAVDQIGTKFKESAASLGAVSAPTIDQGETLAAGAVSAFDGVGDALKTAGQTFGAATVTDEASLSTAGQALSTSLQASFGEISSSLTGLSQAVTPEIKAAVEAIPGCEVLGT